MKSYQKFILTVILIALLGAIFLEITFASADPAAKLGEAVDNVLDITFAVGTSLAVLMLMFGGFIWLTSLGNPSQIKQAKQRIFSALIGLLILLSSASLLALLGIGPGDEVLRAIGIDIPYPEDIVMPELYPRFCAEINLQSHYEALKEFLNQQQDKTEELSVEITALAGNARRLVGSAKGHCNAMRGSWTKCVEPHRKAQFAKCIQESPFYDPEGRRIRDGCPLWVRERQDNLREQNKRARILLNNFRKEVVEATIDSEEVKKVKVILEKLHHCQMNEETILYTHAQANEKGIIGALRLDPANFYCCTRD